MARSIGRRRLAGSAFASIAVRVKALTEAEGPHTDELEERVGWELEVVFADQEALSKFTVAGLHQGRDAVDAEAVAQMR
jgi:hypothetical protein